MLLLVSLFSTSSEIVDAGCLNTLIIVFQTFLQVLAIASPFTVTLLLAGVFSLQVQVSPSFNSLPHLVQNLFSTLISSTASFFFGVVFFVVSFCYNPEAEAHVAYVKNGWPSNQMKPYHSVHDEEYYVKTWE